MRGDRATFRHRGGVRRDAVRQGRPRSGGCRHQASRRAWPPRQPGMETLDTARRCRIGRGGDGEVDGEVRWADVDRHTQRLSFAADILFGIASLTGALNVVCGVLLTRTARGDGVPLETGLRPGSAVNRRQSYLHRTILAGGWTQLAALTGVLALEAAVRQDNYR